MAYFFPFIFDRPELTCLNRIMQAGITKTSGQSLNIELILAYGTNDNFIFLGVGLQVFPLEITLRQLAENNLIFNRITSWR